MEAKTVKQVHDQLISQQITPSMETSTSIDSLPPTVAITSTVKMESDNSFSANMGYKKLYYELLKKHNNLKAEKDKLRDKLLKLSEIEHMNECLRININTLKKQLKSSNAILKSTQKEMSKKIKTLSLNKTISIQNEEKETLSSVFSQNQLDLLLKKKKHVRWTKDEIKKAFKLKHLSKTAYVYVKNELHYPLPGLSSLQRQAKIINMRNSVVHDPSIVPSSSNTADQNQEEFSVENTFKQDKTITGFQIKNEYNLNYNSETDTASEDESQASKVENNIEMTQDAVELLAGWMTLKYKLKFPESCTTTPASTNILNESNAIVH